VIRVRTLCWLLGIGLLFATRASLALPGDGDGDGRPPVIDDPTAGRPPRGYAEERPFVFLMDPSTPARRDFSVEYSLGLGSGVAAERPLPATPNGGGLTHSVGVAYGLTDRVSPFVSGLIVNPTTGDASVTVGLTTGVRWQLTEPGRPFRVAVLGAFLREPGGAMGGMVRVMASLDLDRLRLAANVHAEHLFATGRDPVDMLAMVGASYRVLDWLRLGVEYVVQDFEDAWETDEAEGGARQYVGPTVAVNLDRGRLQLVAGPAFGLNSRTARVAGRLAVVMAF
jgi:hypothetical protein